MQTSRTWDTRLLIGDSVQTIADEYKATIIFLDLNKEGLINNKHTKKERRERGGGKRRKIKEDKEEKRNQQKDSS